MNYNEKQMKERKELQDWKYRDKELEERMKQRNPDITHHFLKVKWGAGGCCPVMLCLEMWEDDGTNGHRSHSHQDSPMKCPSSGDTNNQQGQGL